MNDEATIMWHAMWGRAGLLCTFPYNVVFILLLASSVFLID